MHLQLHKYNATLCSLRLHDQDQVKWVAENICLSARQFGLPFVEHSIIPFF